MHRVIAVAAFASLAVACTEQPQSATAPMELAVFSANAAPQASGGNFGTPLNPQEEVMPPGVTNMSRAVGNATFQLSNDGSSLRYRLIVANIDNVIMAHIHGGAAGANGPVIVWLYPSTAAAPAPSGGGRIDGVIAEGTITAANFLGPIAGQSMPALLQRMRTGLAYVNVHTNDGVAPTNSGPGDYPGGEVRGRIEHRGHH